MNTFSVAQVPNQQKLLKKFVQGEPGRTRLEQVLSTILVLFFVLHKLLPTQKVHSQFKGGKKIPVSENCHPPGPLEK